MSEIQCGSARRIDNRPISIIYQTYIIGRYILPYACDIFFAGTASKHESSVASLTRERILVQRIPASTDVREIEQLTANKSTRAVECGYAYRAALETRKLSYLKGYRAMRPMYSSSIHQ